MRSRPIHIPPFSRTWLRPVSRRSTWRLWQKSRPCERSVRKPGCITTIPSGPRPRFGRGSMLAFAVGLWMTPTNWPSWNRHRGPKWRSVSSCPNRVRRMISVKSSERSRTRPRGCCAGRRRWDLRQRCVFTRAHNAPDRQPGHVTYAKPQPSRARRVSVSRG